MKIWIVFKKEHFGQYDYHGERLRVIKIVSTEQQAQAIEAAAELLEVTDIEIEEHEVE